MSEQITSPPTLDDLRARRNEILRLAAAARCVQCARLRLGGARGSCQRKRCRSAGVSVFDLVELWLDLQDLLGCEVSLITDDPRSRRERFMRRVLAEAVPL